ncbi:MAG: hypothetical protein ACLR17_12925 [Enterobacteriaceae bacterium]
MTAENHTSVGSWGGGRALLMRKGVRCELDTVGLPDEFLLAGALPTLHDRYGISTAKIVEKIKYRLRYLSPPRSAAAFLLLFAVSRRGIKRAISGTLARSAIAASHRQDGEQWFVSRRILFGRFYAVRHKIC